MVNISLLGYLPVTSATPGFHQNLQLFSTICSEYPVIHFPLMAYIHINFSTVMSGSGAPSMGKKIVLFTMISVAYFC